VRAYVALGSNLGAASENLEKAAVLLRELSTGKKLRASPIFRTPALLPVNGPKEWNLPFLNAVVEIEWNESPSELLGALKRTETQLGRVPSARWAPRVIDLDLLVLGDSSFSSPELTLPHPEISRRAFVLDPWKHLAPGFRVPGTAGELSVLALSRMLSVRAPLWMGIMNLTPDSFSDGGALAFPQALSDRLARWELAGVQAIDFGAESTRPGASTVSPEEEWARLEPALRLVRERYHGRIFRPLVSVDTRHAATAEKAIELGAEILNDVSGLADPAFVSVLKNSSCRYVLMHSLSVPADPKIVLPPDADPVKELLGWAEKKLEVLAAAGVSRDRVIFDPGLGFGKNAAQSLELVKRAGELEELPVPVLFGHSRKSFQRACFGERPAQERDGFSIGISQHLASVGVECLRVHEPQLHAEAWAAYSEVRT